MLENYDTNVLNDPGYKEDSVREDIIAPVLKHLGYGASGNHKMVRSRSLSHPFVNIGSKQHKITIVPDYVLEVDDVPRVIIDAKSPHVSLRNSKHAEQAYSYAIHPKIRAKIYSLCNGKEWIIWDIDHFEPVAELTIDDLIEDLGSIERYLEPKAVVYPQKREFSPDFGLRMKKLGLAQEGTLQHFVANQIGNILRVEDNLYTINVSIKFDDEQLAISFDLDKKMYLKLLDLFPTETKEYIASALSRQPYNVYDFEPIWVTVTGKFGSLQHGAFEEFVPIVVEDLELLN